MKINPTDREILRLAVPSIVSNITVPLLGLVDLAIAGHLTGERGGEQYLAAISVGSMIFNVMYWLMGFLRMGTSGMTAQAYGAKDWTYVRQMLRNSLLLAVVIAAVFLVFQIPIRWAALEIIHPSEEVMPLAAEYFNIVIWGAPAMLAIYSLNGWQIGMQDTKAPMYVAIFQNVVNIIASLTFVIGFGMKIEGIALGTLIAQWSGVAVALLLARRSYPATVNDDNVNHHSGDWRRMFSVNRNIFLRTLCMVAVNLTFTSIGAREGDMMLACNTLLMTFFTIFSYVMDGFAFAGEALAGRTFGAKDTAGFRKVTHNLVYHWGLMLAIVFTVAYAFGGSLLLKLITDSEAVVSFSMTYLPWACLIPLAGFLGFVYDGIFIGITATKQMLIASFLSAVTFFIILLGMLALPTVSYANHILWFAFIAYLAMRGSVQSRMMQE